MRMFMNMFENFYDYKIKIFAFPILGMPLKWLVLKWGMGLVICKKEMYSILLRNKKKIECRNWLKFTKN